MANQNTIAIELIVNDNGSVTMRKFGAESGKSLGVVEDAWQTLGVKSGESLEKQKNEAVAAYEKIKNTAESSTQDILRAEKAKNAKISELNNEQHGQQTTMLDSLKKNWMAYSATAMAAVYAIQRVLRESREEYKGFDTALIDMGKVTDRTFALIRDDIMSLPPVLGDVTALMKGYYQVISAGVTNPVAALDLLTVAAKAAKAAHVEQSEVIKALTKMMAGFGGEVRTTAEAADLLFAIEKEGQTTVRELVPIIGDISKASKEAGVNQYEMAGALALITQTAGETTLAATQYRGVIMALLRPNEELTKLIKALGYESSASMVQQLGFADSLKAIRTKADASGVSIGKLFESIEGMLGLASLSADGFETFKDKIIAMGEGAGSAARAFDDFKKSAAAVDQEFGANFKRLMIEMGTTVGPAWNAVTREMSAGLLDTAQNLSILNNKGFLPWLDSLFRLDNATVQVAKSTLTATDIAIEGMMREIDQAIKGSKTLKDLAKDASATLAKREKEEKELAIVVKRAAEERTRAEKAITEVIRKNTFEIDAIGKSQYEKDIARIQQEVDKYAKAGVDKKTIAKFTYSEMEIASAKATALQIKDSFAAADASIKGMQDQIAEGLKLGAAYTKIEADKQKAIEKTMEEWRKAGDVAVTAMEREIAEGVALSNATLARLEKKGEYEREIYKDLRGYEAQYFAASALLIDAQAEKYRQAGVDEVAIRAWVADQHEQNEIKKGKAGDDFFEGVKAGYIEMERNATTFGKVGFDIFNTFAKNVKTVLSDNIFDLLTGNFDRESDDLIQKAADTRAAITDAYQRKAREEEATDALTARRKQEDHARAVAEKAQDLNRALMELQQAASKELSVAGLTAEQKAQINQDYLADVGAMSADAAQKAAKVDADFALGAQRIREDQALDAQRAAEDYQKSLQQNNEALIGGLDKVQSSWDKLWVGMGKTLVNSVADMAVDAAAKEIKLFFGATWTDAAKSVMGTIARIAGGALETWWNSPSGDVLPPGTGAYGLATGGPLQAQQPTWVGEKGPELLFSDKPGYVMEHNQSMAYAARNGGHIPGREDGGDVGVGGEYGGYFTPPDPVAQWRALFSDAALANYKLVSNIISAATVLQFDDFGMPIYSRDSINHEQTHQLMAPATFSVNLHDYFSGDMQNYTRGWTQYDPLAAPWSWQETEHRESRRSWQTGGWFGEQFFPEDGGMPNALKLADAIFSIVCPPWAIVSGLAKVGAGLGTENYGMAIGGAVQVGAGAYGAYTYGPEGAFGAAADANTITSDMLANSAYNNAIAAGASDAVARGIYEETFRQALLSGGLDQAADWAIKYGGGEIKSWVMGEAIGYLRNLVTENGGLNFNYEGADDNGLTGSLSGLMRGIAPRSDSFAFSALNGLDYVPRDNFLIRAHEGERVQTKAEADRTRSGKGGGATYVFHLHSTVTDTKTFKGFAKEIMREISRVEARQITVGAN